MSLVRHMGVCVFPDTTPADLAAFVFNHERRQEWDSGCLGLKVLYIADHSTQHADGRLMRCVGESGVVVAVVLLSSGALAISSYSILTPNNLSSPLTFSSVSCHPPSHSLSLHPPSRKYCLRHTIGKGRGPITSRDFVDVCQYLTMEDGSVVHGTLRGCVGLV